MQHASHHLTASFPALAPGELRASGVSCLTPPQRIALVGAAISGDKMRICPRGLLVAGRREPIDHRTVRALRDLELVSLNLSSKRATVTAKGKWYARTLVAEIINESLSSGGRADICPIES
jgi:hypothetical protein